MDGFGEDVFPLLFVVDFEGDGLGGDGVDGGAYDVGVVVVDDVVVDVVVVVGGGELVGFDG